MSFSSILQNDDFKPNYKTLNPKMLKKVVYITKYCIAMNIPCFTFLTFQIPTNV